MSQASIKDPDSGEIAYRKRGRGSFPTTFRVERRHSTAQICLTVVLTIVLVTGGEVQY